MTESVVTRFFYLKGAFFVPKTKFQGIIFGIMMSITMAYGMEVYNVALKEGGFSRMTNGVFLDALLEAAYMWLFVFLFSNLWGNRIGRKLAVRICRQEDSPFLHTVFISCCTVLVMCPTMSAVAAVLFSVVLGGGSWGQLPAYWVGTILKNFPMALLWNLFAAGPVTRMLFRRLFARQLAAA